MITLIHENISDSSFYLYFEERIRFDWQDWAASLQAEIG
jgi:hypothetical protein